MTQANKYKLSDGYNNHEAMLKDLTEMYRAYCTPDEYDRYEGSDAGAARWLKILINALVEDMTTANGTPVLSENFENIEVNWGGNASWYDDVITAVNEYREQK